MTSCTTKSEKSDAVESDNTVLKLTLVTLVAFLFAGVALLVSANTQLPVNTGSQLLLSLSGSAIDQTNYDRHGPVGHRSALSYKQKVIDFSRLETLSESALNAENLKRNALGILRTLPDYYPTKATASTATAGKATQVKLIDRTLAAPALVSADIVRSNIVRSNRVRENIVRENIVRANVNVNVFLLSNRINNDSQLAELQMQPSFAEFDSQAFRVEPLVSNKSTRFFTGVGFPHIETNKRSATERYKPYKQLVSFSSEEHGGIVPNVRCMGLSAASVAKRASRYDSKIFALAIKHNVSVSLVKAVVAKESCFNNKARSHVGAIGLMQLMPETAKWLKVKRPENPEQNLAAGVRYLAQLRKRFGSDELALAAYNAGPGNVERYNGIPPFAETQNYVRDVMHFYRGYVATTRFVNALNEYQ